VKEAYVKSNLPYNLILDILKKQNKTNIIFYIDLLSVCKGLYNKNNVFNEINYYLENNKPSDQLITEYRNYLNNLFKRFKQYKPIMITFYDDGHNSQNLSIRNTYKQGRSSMSDFIEKDDELMLFRQIKKRYLIEIEKKCNVKNHGIVYYLKEYESDLIPYYIISNNFYNSNENYTLNIIISNDKDLLQCCQFKNTIQCTNRFMPSEVGNKRLKIECWDNTNAIEYIYPKFKRGSLTSESIPLLLALAGDKADNIDGLPGIGPVKAVSLIENYNIPNDPLILKNEIERMPSKIKDNIQQIIENIKMISFKEQIKRIKIEKKEL
jgi:5'-3' exonuclease